MTFSVFSSLTVYALATGWSPGPNNVLLMSMAGQFGFKKCLRFLAGICTGFLTVMLLCAIFSVGINRWLPGIVPLLKYVGAAYIFYLAIQTVRRKPVSETSKEQKVPTYTYGFLLQFINVKVILYGLSAISGYVLPYETSVPILILFAFSRSSMKKECRFVASVSTFPRICIRQSLTAIPYRKRPFCIASLNFSGSPAASPKSCES